MYLPETIYTDDIFLVSYPKSGSTWLRFLLGNYLLSDRCDFTNYYLIIPDIHYNPEQCSKVPRPRFIKSHMPFVPEYKKIVYIVRDGRDVAVSYYFHSLKYGLISKETTFIDFLKLFNQGSIDAFGLWNNHVISWLDNAPDEFLIVRYENLKKDTSTELKRILDFAHLTILEEKILSSINASSFNQMKQLEVQQFYQFERLTNSDPSIPFVRSGSVGQWLDYFNESLLKEFIAIHGSALRRLSYYSNETAAIEEELEIQKRET